MSEGSSSRLQTTARQLSNEHLQIQTDESGSGFDDLDTEEFIDNNLHHQYLVNIYFLSLINIKSIIRHFLME